MPVKVSVVVPVYNPGRHIEDCIASLLRQSLPRDEYEVYFVDDGSTDGTGARLDALAEEHAHVHTLHIPNSGWPGRPRNVGIDASKGEYVYFIDNDDWIGDQALERLHAMAVRNDADVVVGKVVGHGRNIPLEIFRRNIDHASLEKHPLLSLLTPHKLFRRALLDAHGIRFPEGRVRLEDHLFVTKAYLTADVISVLADYPCYHWVRRPDDTNASHGRFDAAAYYGNVRQVLDIVEEHVPPGAYRDRLLRHWYRGKMLGRLGGKVLLGYPEDYRRELFTEIRQLAAERFGEGVVEGLSANLRVRSRLVQAGSLERLEMLARWESSVRPSVRLESLRWESGELHLSLTGHLEHADGNPVRYRRLESSLCLELPPPLSTTEGLTAADRDVTAEVRRSRIDVLVRHREGGGEFLLPVRASLEHGQQPDGTAVLHMTTRARLDPLSAASGRPLGEGTWDLVARIVSTGWGLNARIASPGTDTVPDALRAVVAGDPPRVVAPYWTRLGNLSVRVDRSTGTPVAQHRRRERVQLRVADGAAVLTLRVTLPSKELVPQGIRRVAARWERRRLLGRPRAAARARSSRSRQI